MVTAYPVAGKQKSLDICRAFVEGCGGVVAQKAEKKLPGPAFFYGIDASNVHIWDEVRRDTAVDFYYCDNSYFDGSRQQYFRVTRNRLQHAGVGKSTGKRFAALNIDIKPWRDFGGHVVVCPQSTSFMNMIVGYEGSWERDAVESLVLSTRRKLRVRSWSPDKAALSATLEDDLVGAHALVTWSSAAAITAVLNGVPAFCSSHCAAAVVASTDLAEIEHPRTPTGRELWAGVLADNQWTLEEMRYGQAWADLNGK